MRDSSVLDIFQMICICEQDSDRSAFLHILLKERKGKLFISHTVVESGKGIVDIKLRKLFVFLSKDQFSIERFYRCTEGVERLKKKLMIQQVIAVFQNKIPNLTFTEMKRAKEIKITVLRRCKRREQLSFSGADT